MNPFGISDSLFMIPIFFPDKLQAYSSLCCLVSAEILRHLYCIDVIMMRNQANYHKEKKGSMANFKS